jgi:Sporulation protein and related proteins
MTLSSGGGAAVAVGRGWGHGVGMVQWGAYGKARRGLSASDILAYYYGGLRPQTSPEPGLIHVQVASGLTAIASSRPLRRDPQRRAARRGSRDDRRRRPALRDHAAVTRRTLLVGAVAVAVAVAFADSSIVVLALPELYARFDTTIEGVAWVITSYNLVLAISALLLVFVVHHARANLLLAAGTIVFLAASIACALADSIGFLIAARSIQGLGGALLLAGSLPVLGP